MLKKTCKYQKVLKTSKKNITITSKYKNLSKKHI